MSNRHDRSGRGHKPRGEGQTSASKPHVQSASDMSPAEPREVRPAPVDQAEALDALREIMPAHVPDSDRVDATASSNTQTGADAAPQQEHTTMADDTMKTVGDKTADQARQASDQFRSAAAGAMDTAQDQAKQTADRAQKAGEQLREVTTSAMNTAQEQAKQNADYVRRASEQVRGAAENTMNNAQEQAKQALEHNQRLTAEMGDLTRGNVEAAVQSSRIAAEGYQAIGREVVEFGRKSFEGFSATIKQLAEAKTPADVLRIQGEFARQSFDTAVSASAQMSERIVKLAGESAEPMQSRVAVATQKMQSANG